jgi:hypothetical protein
MNRFFVIILILISGCSMKVPPDRWKANASNAFESYQEYYLQGKSRLAATELKKAIKEAACSADMEPLARIYLGECALHAAVLIDDECGNYIRISNMLGTQKELKNYSLMLQGKMDDVDAAVLPRQYRDFVRNVSKKDFKAAFSNIKGMPETSSKLIAASLMKDQLDKGMLAYVIDQASFRGYKKSVIAWLRFSKKSATEKEKVLIEQKLRILND